MLIIIVVARCDFTSLAVTPWSPDMEAWSGAPVPASNFSRVAPPLERQGAMVFQAKQCRNCHALGGEGGQRGPALDDVATRLTRGSADSPGHPGRWQHAGLRQEPQPSAGDRLVTFLETLHSAGQRPAENAALVSTASVPKGP